MRISINDIKEFGNDLTATEADPWLVEAVAKVDEHDRLAEFRPKKHADRGPSLLKLQMSKVDQVIVFQGKLSTDLFLLCSRCGEEFKLPIDTKFYSLYCQDPAMAGVGYLDSKESKPKGNISGVAKHAHQEDFGNEPDITYITDEFVDIGDVVSEQLRLEVPFQPLCKPECQGVCSHCGTNLNRGRCACAKIVRNSPFEVLKNLRKS